MTRPDHVDDDPHQPGGLTDSARVPWAGRQLSPTGFEGDTGAADPDLLRALSTPGDDLALMEDALRDSGLDWTAVRPPRLTDRPLTGAYRTATGRNLRRGFLVSRADVAHLMLRLLDQPQTIGRAIGVAN